jgi:hypothetical protein
MRSTTQGDAVHAASSWDAGSSTEADAGLGGRDVASGARSVVTAASLKAAIARLRELTETNAARSSQEALAANLVLLRNHGVDDEILDLVVEMVVSQNVDEETTAAMNYLASGFLLALLAIGEEAERGGAYRFSRN